LEHLFNQVERPLKFKQILKRLPQCYKLIINCYTLLYFLIYYLFLPNGTIEINWTNYKKNDKWTHLLNFKGYRKWGIKCQWQTYRFKYLDKKNKQEVNASQQIY
jgi:hypothetical protein